MKTLFGLRIFPERKHLTDEEFVSEARVFLARYEGKRKWLLGFHIVGDTKGIRTKRLLVHYYDACIADCPDEVAADGVEGHVG
jgi:hypothetical protein